MIGGLTDNQGASEKDCNDGAYWYEITEGPEHF